MISRKILNSSCCILCFVDEIHLLQMRKEKDFCLKIKSTLSNPDRRASFEDTLSGLPDTEVRKIKYLSEIKKMYSTYRYIIAIKVAEGVPEKPASV